MKIAVVILALGEYWKGAKVMFHTLRKYGKLPNHVDTIALGAECLGGPPLKQTWDHIPVPVNKQWFSKVAAKFEALTLGYDRVIMLDADMLCIGDCSLLWSDKLTKPFYAVRDIATKIYYGNRLREIGLNPELNFNAGTMVFNKCDILDELLNCIANGLQTYDGGDQGYLNAYFQLIRPDLQFGFLPTAFNCVLDRNFKQVIDRDKRIVHFTGANANPWNPDVPHRDDRWRFIKWWQREWEECK